MSKRCRTEAGAYIDPFAFLPRATNLSRQIRRKDEIEAGSAPYMPVAKPVSMPRPRQTVQAPAKKAVEKAVDAAFDKKAYMRSYMAKKRAEKKAATS